MESVKRALTENEVDQIFRGSYTGTDWQDLIMTAMGPAIFFGLIALFGNLLATKILGWDPAYFIGLKNIHVAVWLATFILCAAWLFRLEKQNEKRVQDKKQAMLESRSFIVELHSIKKCQLIRDIEHGQPMFFVLSNDDIVLYVFAGQDVWDEEWEGHPTLLSKSERPRDQLKIIRDPNSDDCLYSQWFGSEIPMKSCLILELGQKKWPLSGSIIDVPWQDIESKYQLNQI